MPPSSEAPPVLHTALRAQHSGPARSPPLYAGMIIRPCGLTNRPVCRGRRTPPRRHGPRLSRRVGRRDSFFRDGSGGSRGCCCAGGIVAADAAAAHADGARPAARRLGARCRRRSRCCCAHAGRRGAAIPTFLSMARRRVGVRRTRYRRDAVDLSRSVPRTALCAGLCAEPVAAGACPDLLRSGERALAVVTLLWAPGVALTLSRRRRAFDVGCSVGCRAARPRLRRSRSARWQFCVFVAPACEPIATRDATKVTNLCERGYAWSTQSPKENWRKGRSPFAAGDTSERSRFCTFTRFDASVAWVVVGRLRRLL